MLDPAPVTYTPPMSLNADIQLLARIRRHARAIVDLTKTKTTVRLPEFCSVDVPLCLVFPEPQPITIDLTSLGLHPVASKRISAAYCRTSSQVKNEAEAQCKRGLRVYTRSDAHPADDSKASAYSSAMLTRYLGILERWRKEIINTVVSRLRNIQQHRSPVGVVRDKRPFNQVRG